MTPTVVVVGLGPGDVDLLTDGTRRAIEDNPRRFGRTRRHPAASALGSATFFDEVYDTSETIDDVYRTIVHRVVSAATESGTVLYAVPGSPVVAERTVAMLTRDRRIRTEIVPALSFLDLAWVRLGIDPHDRGVTVVDGHRFPQETAGRRGPFMVGQCETRQVLSDIKLAYDDPPSERAVLLWHLGLTDERVEPVSWDDIDRHVDPDHLTSLYVPQGGPDLGSAMLALSQLVTDLRAGCPWDRRQTHRSLQRYLVEETHELLEAIDGLDGTAAVDATDDPIDHLAEELGDVLFQVVFHATLATEEGWFTLTDVAQGVHDKLYRRHPHVFGDAVIESLDDLSRSWEATKATEKERASVMDGIPRHLPTLLRAVKVGKKARVVEAEGAIGAVDVSAALAALDPSDDASVGSLLFALASAAADAGVDPESALRRAADRMVAEVRGAGL